MIHEAVNNVGCFILRCFVLLNMSDYVYISLCLRGVILVGVN